MNRLSKFLSIASRTATDALEHFEVFVFVRRNTMWFGWVCLIG
jgi:hypothetical protein